MINLELKRVDTDAGRYYEANFAQRKVRMPSVNTLIDKFQPKDGLINWQKSLAKKHLASSQLATMSQPEIDLVCYQMAEKIKTDASSRGTKSHNVIEDYFRNRDLFSEDEWKIKTERFYPFLQLLKPVGVELQMFYREFIDSYGNEDVLGAEVGFGGTADCVSRVDGSKLYSKNNNPLFEESVCLLDWKFPNKPKYPKQQTPHSHYYPLIRYSLQLSAYIKAFNQNTKNEYSVDKAIVALCPIAPCRTLYLYYFSPEAVEWYWNNFRKMLVCYFYKLDFNWKQFEKDSDDLGYLGERIYLN